MRDTLATFRFISPLVAAYDLQALALWRFAGAKDDLAGRRHAIDPGLL
jgi:hypothetical protein